MLKMHFNSEAISPRNEYSSSLLLDLPNSRYNYYMESIMGDTKQAQSLRKELQQVANTKGRSLTEVINKLVSYKVTYWQFDFTKGPEFTLQQLRNAKHLPLSAIGNNTSLMESETVMEDGEVISIDDNSNAVLDSLDSGEILTNYKEILQGVSYITKKMIPRAQPGDCIKILYCKWLHMINKEEGFLKYEMLVGDYRSKQKPNEIIRKYSSSDNKTADKLLDEYASEYIDTHLDGMYNINEYFKVIYYIFNNILKYNILDVNTSYLDETIENEINYMITHVPNDKFSSKFLNKTENLMNWNELTLNEVLNEYKIDEFFEPINISTKIPSIVPMTTSPLRPLKKEIDFMQHLDLKSRSSNTKNLGLLMKRSYTNRLSKLMSSTETHSTYRTIIRNQEFNEGIFNNLNSTLNISMDLIEDKLREFRIKFPDELGEDEIYKEMMMNVYETLTNIGNKLYMKYKKEDWNVPEMEGLFARINMINNFKNAINTRYGILYIFNKPIVLKDIYVVNPKNTDFTSIKFLPDEFFISEEGLLVNKDYIIKPKNFQLAESIENKSYAVKEYIEI